MIPSPRLKPTVYCIRFRVLASCPFRQQHMLYHSYTKSLSQSLQGRSLDIIDGYPDIKTVTNELQGVRDIAEETCCAVYSKAEAMANILH